MDASEDAEPDLLSAYRAKRSPDRTPEPFGGFQSGPGRLFVVHKHAARRLHFDLRLEMEGVLRSWAVPRGPSYDTHEKRLAVLVEDHPLEYGDFEGKIPEGNYGAGAVIVWDRGEWVPIEDPLEGLKKGKLLFDLKGYKLRGRWTLVKIKKSQKDWLLIKERDQYAVTDPPPFPEESVLSGLSVEELGAGHTPTGRILAELDKLKVPRRVVDPAKVELMLAEPRDTAFSKPGWVFEPKLDGYRILATHDGTAAALRSRNGNDLTASFPEVARAIKALPVPRAVLDGELVIPDAEGRPSFQALQKRARLSRAVDIRHKAAESPGVLYAFDLLGFDDRDLRALPLTERKRILRMMLPALGAIRFVDHFETDGAALMEHVTELGLEGVVGKKADAPYKGGRSPLWLKVRADQNADFAVVGFTQPKGTRGGFGSLQLGDWVDGELVYGGRAGSGFTEKQLAQVRQRLEATVRKTPPCNGPRPWPHEGELPAKRAIPDSKDTTWVEPTLVCEVQFKEWTEEGLLRQPVFLRFRDDKTPEECVRQGSAEAVGAPEAADDPAPAPRLVKAAEVPLSNLQKVYWPAEKYTKGDLIEYYRTISPWLLPYLKDRPLVLTRFPDGIEGKSFYQKDAPDFTPDWIRTVPVWSEDSQRTLNYFVCDNLETLLYVANMGSIPLHIWASRADALELPDWCILDLDPKGAPFSNVVKVAVALHRLCEDLGLPHYAKTSGSTGIHVMIPLGRQCTFEQSRTLGELLARVVIGELPDISTIVRPVKGREGKVYLDYLQNRTGQLIAAPFSVRPLPGAPVSMPLEWKEVNQKLSLLDHTILTAPKRMEKRGKDPMRPVLEAVPDLPAVLQRLLDRGGAGSAQSP
ncbi:MAG TPA: DNA ligase D [Gemmatimonadales bacterium]|nr:DNA ligase D [Gemmatimonadales bacterium]